MAELELFWLNSVMTSKVVCPADPLLGEKDLAALGSPVTNTPAIASSSSLGIQLAPVLLLGVESTSVSGTQTPVGNVHCCDICARFCASVFAATPATDTTRVKVRTWPMSSWSMLQTPDGMSNEHKPQLDPSVLDTNDIPASSVSVTRMR